MDTLSHTPFTRRSVLRSAVGAGLAAAAVLPLTLPAGPAKASNYRGIVGVIKPRATDSALVDMIKLLPEGIGVIPVYLNLTQGSREEYGSNYATYEKHIAYLASQKCNVIAIEGAPPFMLLGPTREAEMVDGWKRKYNTDMFTSSQNQVNAFKALKAKRILGITSGSGGPDMNKVRYPGCTTAGAHIRALTALRPIKPTSIRCRSARQLNLGRRSTYQCGKTVQTTGATSV